MCFLVKVFCIFFYTHVFCACVAPFVDDENLFDERNDTELHPQPYALAFVQDSVSTAVGSLPGLIVQDLQRYKEHGCSYSHLITHYSGFPQNKTRDFQMAIIFLRNQGYDIIHNGDGNYKLLDGKRRFRKDCCQKELWGQLGRDSTLVKKSDVLIALHLSELGYFVRYARVRAIKTLWRFVFQTDCTDHLLRKKKAWDVILQDFAVYDQGYYMKHPDVQEKFVDAELVCFKKMLSFYQDNVEHKEPRYIKIKERLIHYLMISSNGAQEHEIQEFLSSNDQEKMTVWMGIRILVRGGYGQQIDYCDGRFFWGFCPQKIYIDERGLLQNICDVFEENTSCEQITLALYRRGFFEVTPFDVRNILDVLVEAKCLNHRCVRGDLSYVPGGLIARYGGDASYIHALREDTTLWRIRENLPIHIMHYLKTQVYPQYFGWRVPEHLVSKKRKKKCQEASDEQQGKNKKCCLGDEEEAPGAEVLRHGFDIEFSNLAPDEFDEHQLFSVLAGDLDEELDSSEKEDTMVGTNAGCEPLSTAKAVMPREHILPPDLYEHSEASSSKGSSQPEHIFSVESHSTSVGERAQKRQKVLLEYLKKKEGIFCSSEELLALYDQEEKQATVLEDALSLIQGHCNIEYNKERRQYRLCTGQWSALAPKNTAKDLESSCMLFFCKQLKERSFIDLNVGEKTYYLYMHGYQRVPLSTVALFVAIGRSPGSVLGLNQRERRLMALKDKILESETIEPVVAYQGCFAYGCDVRSDDVDCVKKSLGLYTDGLAILAKNTIENSDAKLPLPKNKGLEYPEILDFFTKNKGKVCTFKDLQSVINVPSRHNAREVYRTIADLRAAENNIIHNDKGYILYDGCRETKPGCYRRVAWRLLEGNKRSHLETGPTFIAVSDLGYNPVWSVVERIVLLKKLCECDDTLPTRKVNAWKIITADQGLRDARYYAGHSHSPVHLNDADMRSLTYCWKLYNYLAYNQKSEMAQAAKMILEKHQKGISLQDFKTALFINLPKPQKTKVSVWDAISVLMCNGYAGQIDVIGEVVFWRPHAPNIMQTDQALLPAFCQIPLGYEHGPATVWLHKMGHLNVTPWDIAQLLDIFAFMGCREQSRYDALRILWANVSNGLEDRKNLTRKEAVFIQRIEWLQGTGFLQKIEKGVIVDLDALLHSEDWSSEADAL